MRKIEYIFIYLFSTNLRLTISTFTDKKKCFLLCLLFCVYTLKPQEWYVQQAKQNAATNHMHEKVRLKTYSKIISNSIHDDLDPVDR